MPIRMKANDPRIPASLREQVKPKRQKRPKADPQLFMKLCQDSGLPCPVPEYRFCDGRKWAIDWAWLRQRIALEIQGGIFTQGRHVRGAALLNEMEKLNALACMGWRVLYCTPKQFARGDAIGLVRRALGMDR